MTPYQIRFKDGAQATGFAKWDGKHAEDLLLELGLTALDARLRIEHISADAEPYETFVDYRARQKEAA